MQEKISMLNSHKLLYILSDLSYVAELLPAKKEYTFTVQAFRQINGEFIDENELIPTSIDKLFSKLEKEEYHLILPDFLFTNTIVNVEGTSESTVLDHVNKVLLPDLDLTKETHEIETTVLTSFKGTSKVQISAIEKSVLAPIRAAAQKAEVTISAVSPLTWAIKAIISLEPSISVLQIGSQLYTAQHYIGVDQAGNFPIDDYDAIVETIKTLKGAEPSIQSVYLVSSALVEEDIKEKLSDTLPIQQLASFKEDDVKMPSYIKFIIESTMRTLSISDFPVPRFKVGKASEEDLLVLTQQPTSAKNDKDSEDDETDDSDLEETKKPEANKESSKEVELDSNDLPAPAVMPLAALAVKETESTSMTNKTKSKVDEDETEVVVEEEETPDEPVSAQKTQDEASKEKTVKQEDAVIDDDNSDEVVEENAKTEEVDKKKNNEIDLSQFASKDTDSDIDTDSQNENELAVESKADSADSKDKEEKPLETIKNLDKPQKKVIKNSSGVNNMLKMVFITIAVFFITIAIGVGVGLGLLKLSENKTGETTPTVVSETPQPTATPEPTPEPVEINKEEISILVVNATTKAGYAGTVKTLLTDAEIPDVTAANAKGEYEEGTDYIVMKEENPSLQKLLEESTQLEFEYSAEIDVEDATGKYDAVIVLAK